MAVLSPATLSLIIIGLVAGAIGLGIIISIIVLEIERSRRRMTTEQAAERLRELLKQPYPQFLPESDCDERLRRLEMAKDTRIDEQRREILKLKGGLLDAKVTAKVRAEVHRDDYLRSGVLIAGLNRLREIGGEVANVVDETLNKAFGATLPQQHCASHSRYHPNCPDCVGIGRAPVPDVESEVDPS